LNSRIEILDHTADIGIYVQAGSLIELLTAAAQAMMQIVVSARPLAGEEAVAVQIEFDDYEQLLVQWLSELNFLLQTRRFLFTACRSVSMTADRFTATVVGVTADPRTTRMLGEIKAVTYHKIQVASMEQGNWEARVYFDL